MLYVYSGTDRDKARAEMHKALTREGKKRNIVRVTDASAVPDLEEALRGGGMFGEKRAVVLDGVFANEEMRGVVLNALPHMKESDEPFFILEGKLDADTRRVLEKHAEAHGRFDAKKEKEGGEIFSLAYALKRGDKKALWVAYQRALARGEAPEAVHGVLFWGAKDMLLRARARSPEQRRGAKLVAELAELPHDARRQGFELEYAIERYLLNVNKS